MRPTITLAIAAVLMAALSVLGVRAHAATADRQAWAQPLEEAASVG